MKKKILVLLLLVILILSCNQSGKNDKKLIEKFRIEILNLTSNSIIDISKLTDFDWDFFYTIPPYTPLETIQEYTHINRIPFVNSIESSDSITLLLFVKNNDIVKAIKYPRNYGDFSDLKLSKFRKNDSKFKVVIKENWYFIERVQ